MYLCACAFIWSILLIFSDFFHKEFTKGSKNPSELIVLSSASKFIGRFISYGSIVRPTCLECPIELSLTLLWTLGLTDRRVSKTHRNQFLDNCMVIGFDVKRQETWMIVSHT